jgi:hypothetical protein
VYKYQISYGFEIIFPELILCLHVQVLVATVRYSFIFRLHFSYFVTVNVASIITLFCDMFHITLQYSPVSSLLDNASCSSVECH